MSLVGVQNRASGFFNSEMQMYFQPIEAFSEQLPESAPMVESENPPP